MRNFLYIFICIFFGCAVNSQDRLPDERFTGLKAHIDSLLVVYHAAGLSVAVIDNNETVYAEGFGYRDVANKLPVDAQTLFGIGSCTKAFTAAVLGRLQADRKLSFTDKPSKYVDQLSFFSEAMNDSIQIEHLLTHSTGLGSQSSESTAIIFETPNARDLIPRIKYLRPAIGVGKELMYNNLMYTVAGMVGEDITGVPWEENIETMLFHPIGMKRTYADYKSAVNQPNFSYGYAVDSIIPARVLPEVLTTRAPAGSIFSSANDMSLWVQTWMNNGEVKGKQVLPKAYTTNAVSEKMLWPSNPSDTTAIATYYGYGWLNTIDNGNKRVEHSGGVSGYGSNVVFFPDENLGVVVLTNQTASSLASAVTDEIINRLLPKIEKETHEVNHSLVHTILPEDTPTTLNVTLPPSHDLSEFVGVYSHPGFGAVDVTYTGKTLYADFPMTKMRLAHNENNEFFDHYTEQVPLIMWNFMRLNFRPNSNGKVDALLINLDREPVVFKKQ